MEKARQAGEVKTPFHGMMGELDWNKLLKQF
jgi:hypothetical protein